MKKLILLLSITLIGLTSFGQVDTTAVDADSSKLDVYAGAIVASRNYARGVNFGAGPSIQPYAGVTYKKFTLEFFGALTADGKYDYGTTHDFSLSYNTAGFMLGVHDYYFFSKYGNHNYFFQTADPNMNGHYYEAQVGYASGRLDFLAAYNFYNTNLKVEGDYWKGVYLEGKYSINDNLSFVVAGLTGPSIVNFYEAAGFTTIGLEWSSEVQITDKFSTFLDAYVHVNPNYKNIAPGVQQAPMNFFVSLSF